jgi:hypothetical protein
MSNPLQLSASQAFDKERFSRAIAASKDTEELRGIAKTLLDGWFSQRAATQWILKTALANPGNISPSDLQKIQSK